MSRRALRLLVALCALSACCAFTCPAICRCDTDLLQCNRDTQLSNTGKQRTVRSLRLVHLPLREVPSHAFQKLINVTRIEIAQSHSIRVIKTRAFLSLHDLAQISILNIKSLSVIEKGAFTDLPMLEYLSISNTGMMHFPDLGSISSSAPSMILEMADNKKIEFIPPNSFQGITVEYIYVELLRNGFQEIKSHAFNGSRMNTLILRDNGFLSMIHEDAFEGASGPSFLDVSSTALRSLPTKGLKQVRFLRATSTYALKTLPPLEGLTEVEEAELTYPSHCCAFHMWRRKQRENALKNITKLCDIDHIDEIEPTSADVIGFYDTHFQYPDMELGCPKSPFISCTPKTDEFNPCEDLLGSSFLRCLTWIISVSAVTGNLIVLVILLISQQKLTITKFLMCNLAFADLCMGLYLVLIAFIDYQSSHEYYNHALNWQTGGGCGVAGFLTVFASQLSVYTLTVISLERWHTITNAMYINKRLQMRHVIVMMGVGWIFSLLVALLPLVGVSSYSKVSICLPMDIDSLGSQMYVVTVLVLNVCAFLAVCYCYICIYLSVRNPEHATRCDNTQIAKRMAVLIFTDFLCMAPISFFAISAALRMPLITVSHAKFLLILFYPINAVCNPFLYTIFTRGFRKDIRALVTHCNCCLCKSGPSCTQKIAPKAPHSHSLYAYHIKMKDCFVNKGTT